MIWSAMLFFDVKITEHEHCIGVVPVSEYAAVLAQGIEGFLWDLEFGLIGGSNEA